jgi:hypothetical protein
MRGLEELPDGLERLRRATGRLNVWGTVLSVARRGRIY